MIQAQRYSKNIQQQRLELEKDYKRNIARLATKHQFIMNLSHTKVTRDTNQAFVFGEGGKISSIGKSTMEKLNPNEIRKIIWD